MSSVSCLMAKRATLHLMDALVSRDKSFVRVPVHVHQSAGGAPSSSTVPRPRARGNRQTSRRLGLYGSEVVKLTTFNNFVIGRIVKYAVCLYARLGHLRPGVSAVVLKHGRETCLSPLARTTDSVGICDLSSWARHNHGHYELVCTLRWSDT